MDRQLATIQGIVARKSAPTGTSQIVAGQVTMSSRAIAELTGKKHADVLRDIRAMLRELNGAVVASNFAGYYRAENGKWNPEFSLPKRELLVLISGYSVKMRAKIIDRWQELEQQEAQAAHPALLVDLNDSSTLQRLLIAHTGKAIELEAKVGALSQAVEAQAPAVREHARVMFASGSQCIADAAKDLGVMQTKLFRWLDENGWIFKRPPGSEWLAHADKLKRGLMAHKVTLVRLPDGGEKTRTQARVTPKGLLKLAGLVPGAAALSTAGAADA